MLLDTGGVVISDAVTGPNIPIEKLLERLGFSAEHAQRIRLGGVVGKVTAITVAGLFAIAAIGFRLTSSPVQVLALLLVPFIIGGVLYALIRFSKENPALALLEGAEYLRWEQMKIEAKGQKALPAKDIVVTPDPLIISSEDDQTGDAGRQ